MASKRRAAGELDESLVAFLEREGRPLTGLMLTEMLREQGEVVAVSLVFRALRKLVERGTLHKLLLSRGYVPTRSLNEIYLHCASCGTVGRIVSEESFLRIEDAAERSSFRVTRPIVEVMGRCAHCLEREADDAAPLGRQSAAIATTKSAHASVEATVRR
jgi:Fur family zinc uptake transcriptional regulator